MKKNILLAALSSVLILTFSVACGENTTSDNDDNTSDEVVTTVTDNPASKLTGISTDGSSGTINEDDAKAMALTHAELEAEDVSSINVEKEQDGDYVLYMVTFETEEWTYEYNILGSNGAILYNDKLAK